MKLVLTYLENMATQVCNLSCQGFTNYSDFNHKGYQQWDVVREQIIKWQKVIDIKEFGIIGGEPLINPHIEDWIIGCKELFPNNQVMFVTNGLLLHKHPRIIDLMYELGGFTFKITKHKSTPELNNIIKDIFNRYEWEHVFEYGIHRVKTKNDFRFYTKEPTIFYKSYIGDFKNMMPHDSHINDAFDICTQKTCPLLHNGKIYKCSTGGLLKDILELNGNPNPLNWHNLTDKGILPSDDPNTIKKFIDNYGKPNHICKQCPTSNDMNSMLNHTKTCTFK